MRNSCSRTLRLVAIASVLLAPLFCAAQDATRGIVPEKFLHARPAGEKPAKVHGYELSTPPMVIPAAQTSRVEEVGVTVWRLRPSKPTDDGPRLLVQTSSQTSEWTPVRVRANSPLHVGDKVRITVESPRAGYLYVVDREEYGDGTMGEPYLIFPTTRTRGGDNEVVPGRLIDIPGQKDSPPYFTLRPSRSDQIGELLTIVVTAKPLENLKIGPSPAVIAPQQVAEWIKQGGGRSERLEMIHGAGEPWSRAEQEAGASATRLLTQDDPPPQTIFRVVSASPDVVAVSVRLRQLHIDDRKK